MATFRLPGSLYCAGLESGQCHVNGFYFCLIMLFAGKPRDSMAGCSTAVSQCLTGGFVLSLSGCSQWKTGEKVGVGSVEEWGTHSELGEPPGALAVSATLPPSPLASFLLSFIFFSVVLPLRSASFSLALSFTKLDLRPIGPNPRTGL